MTALAPSASDLTVSRQLKGRLRAVARRRWYVLAAVGVFKTLITALVALLVAVLLLGYFQNLWLPARMVLAFAVWILVVGSALRFLRPAIGRWSLNRAAFQIERDTPDLQERISSAIELAGETDPKFRGSRELIAHLFRQAEADAAVVQPARVVPTGRILRWAILFIPILLAWAVTMLTPATTHTALVGLYRVFLPWKAAIPASLTEVLVTPGDVTLAQGQSVGIIARLPFDTGVSSASRHATLVRNFVNGPHLTDEMEHFGIHDYHLRLDDAQQSFSYKVSTDQGDSAWFSATVHPKPQITNLEVRCDYPAYTGIAPSVTSSGDGSIQALVGTRVTLSVHTALPIVLDKSQISISDAGAGKSMLPLKQSDAGNGDYLAQFVVKNSGNYRINLSNEFGLTNTEEQSRSIVAQPDEAPTITIRSPEPQVTVGADDVVSVKYTAHDDFAVARIEALLQVGDQPAQTVPVNFTATDKRTVTGPAFSISVAELLKAQGDSQTQSISYQLKVTDNRDPDPQVGLSVKQTLKIDRHAYEKFEAKEDRKTAQELTEAIRKAVNQLNQEQQQVQPTRDIDPAQQLESWRRKQLHQAAQALPKTSSDLAQAADEAKDGVFADIARQVHEIATKQIPPAADDAAEAELNADKGQDRKAASGRSVVEITQARDALQKLLDDQAVENADHQAEAARDLADAAQKQQEAADKMQSPQQQSDRQAQKQQQQAMRDQEQANQKLQQALQQSEALRDPAAQQTAAKLQDLIRKVGDLQKQQDTTAKQTQKQQAATDIQQKANALAQKQEALNKEIQKSAEQNKEAMQKANANVPAPEQQQNIVKALDRNDIHQAHDQMQQAANQLQQAAQQLQNQAKSNDLHATPQQQEAINKDQHAEDQARQDQEAAQKAANDLAQAAPAQQNPAQDAPAEAPQDPPADNPAIAEAKQAAKEIQKQAADLHPRNDDAKHVAEAAQQDAKAAEHAADQAGANPQDAQKDLKEVAKDLKQAAGELADAAKKNADSHKAEMVQAQQKDAQAAAAAAAQQAKEQAALAQAAEDPQKALAQVPNPPAPDQTAQQQAEIAHHADEAEHQAEQLQQQAKDAHNPDVQARAEQANADLAHAQELAAQAAKAQQQAAHAQQEAAKADDAAHAKAAERNADHALAQAAAQQQLAQTDLAKAQSELQNLPSEQTASAQQHADTDAQTEPGQHQGAAKGQATPQQQAAQAAQEAAQAQQDASQQNPQAAQQAASALARAAQEMARATPGMHQGQPDNLPGNEPAKQPSPVAGQSPDPKQGIAAGSAVVAVPESVKDIGITADQWAILPPLQKKDLLNAAQQSGPPGYRQMTKDYFAKIAKIQAATAGQ